MSTKIKFLTIENHVHANAKTGACVATVVHNGTWTKEDMACEAAKRCGLTPLQATMFMDALAEVACEGIASGNKLHFGPFSIGISLKGSFKEANSRFDPQKNGLGIFFAPHTAMTRALSNLEPENATPMDRPWLYEVCGEGAGLNEVVIGAPLVANGSNIRIDTDRTDEGVWLETASGEKVAKGEVTDTDAGRLVCVFRGPVAAGACRLAIYTRNGGAASGAPAVIRRRVKVVG